MGTPGQTQNSLPSGSAIVIHRSSSPWPRSIQGIDYEVVRGPVCPGKRADLQRLSGQRLYPVIEFENGSIYREESKDMAATIRAGKLDEKRGLAS